VRKNRPRRLLSWMMTAAMITMAFSACSSNGKTISTSSPSTAAAGSSGAASQGATGSPIKVGFICSCSGGPFGVYSIPAKDEYKAWENMVNASGGIDGHPVQVIYDDDGSSPGTSVTDAQTRVAAKLRPTGLFTDLSASRRRIRAQRGLSPRPQDLAVAGVPFTSVLRR